MNKTNFTSIRLDDQERAAVDSKMEQTGLGQAAAIRLIIREWSEMKKLYATVPVVTYRPETIEEAASRG
jgi:hypothetical protein